MILTTVDTILTTSNIIFVIGLLGSIFAVYFHFKKPQEDSEIKQVITDKDLGTKATILAQKEAEGKAQLLAQQVQTEKEFNSKKFIEITERFNSTDHKIETLIETVNSMNLNISKELMRVATIVSQHLITSDSLK